MELSPIQSTQIIWEIESLQRMVTGMVNSIKVATTYSDKLINDHYSVAALIVQSQLIEEGIRVVLAGHRGKRRILKIRKESDPDDDKNLNYEGKTLGELRKLLKQFTGDCDLNDLLSEFNNLRMKAVHKAFLVSKSVDSFEKIAETYLRGNDFKELTKLLSDEHIKIKTRVESLCV